MLNGRTGKKLHPIVREAHASRHNGAPINGPPLAPQYHSEVKFGGLQGVLN